VQIKKAELSERRRIECESELEAAKSNIEGKLDEINSFVDE
jgi:hypothetical protein